MMPPPPTLLLLLGVLPWQGHPALALDNGLALTPPMGWRSWNFFQGDIDDAKIRGQIDAMVSPRPVKDCRSTVRGNGAAASCTTKLMSLHDLGYVHAGVDDGWQLCDSFHVMPSNTSVFHDADGRPIVNTTKFPNLKVLSSYAESKDILLGWYNNNCICHESGGHIGHSNDTWVNLSYIGDVEQLLANNFKGIKVDNCGLHNDMDRYADLMNKTGLAFLVERSDQGHGTPTNLSWCPYNIFRSSGDIRPNWGSIHNNLHTVNEYTNISRPGCWAYPDMLQCGNLAGPLATAESRSHFGAWCSTSTYLPLCKTHADSLLPQWSSFMHENRLLRYATAVVSSPLVLGMDMTNETTMAEVWPYISNVEALDVNQAFEGDPGRLIYPPIPQPDNDVELVQHAMAGASTPVEVWAKALPRGAVALLAINTDASASADLKLQLATALHKPANWCSAGNCKVRDVWRQMENGTIGVDGMWGVTGLAPHDSHFVVVSLGTSV